jgi:lipopolysaccharide/colanic/teichoic acid biosynthesis glycosyltransferase
VTSFDRTGFIVPDVDEPRTAAFDTAGGVAGRVAKRALDVVVATALLLVLAPALVVVAAAVKLDSRGPTFFRCRRVGRGGRQFGMLKFRKMVDGASGAALTAADDERFTSIGRFLARTKLDELPQLWNVLRGDMSLVGPRPEDPRYVRLEPRYEQILVLRPGITGLSQLAFARECDVLDVEDAESHYVGRILPSKAAMDALYVARSSFLLDLRILAWTAVAMFGVDVAVNRETARLSVRRRPQGRRVFEPGDAT